MDVIQEMLHRLSETLEADELKQLKEIKKDAQKLMQKIAQLDGDAHTLSLAQKDIVIGTLKAIKAVGI
jgi:iron uptake system EfeUOB component EfeO/EfeM